MAYEHDIININEPDAAINALDDFEAKVAPHVGERMLAVLSADSAFQNREVRARARELGIIENIHEVSHAQHRPSTDRDRESADRRQFELMATRTGTRRTP